MSRAKISLCVITKDEESCIGDCLASVRALVDEIIVVDTGSSDGTIGVAESYGAKVHHFTWCDDFAKARNESLKHATGDWVLVLDSDEVLSTQDHSKVVSLIEKGEAGEYDGYYFDQRNYTNNHRYAGWRPCDDYDECKAKGFFTSKLVRLFKRKKEHVFRNKVHEIIEPAILEAGGKVGNSGIPIHHYGYLKGEETLDEKREKYLKLGLAQIKEKPDDPRPYYETARIYKHRGEFEKAAEFFKKVATLREGYRSAYFNLGDIYKELEKYDLSEEYYQKAIAAHPRNENNYVNLGLLYAHLKKPNEAFTALKKALQINPYSAAAYHNLAVLLIKCKKYREGLHILEQGYARTKLEKFRKAAEKLRERLG